MPRKNNSRQNKTLGEKLNNLAERIADQLNAGQDVDEAVISGFRAITAYYAMVNKLPPEDNNGATAFNGYKDALAVDGDTRARRNGAAGPRDDNTPVVGTDF